MTHDPQRFVIVDPRSMEGNPYEVAQRAVSQLRALQRLVELSLGPVELMARNAELERQMALDQEPDAAGWPESPQGRMLSSIRKQIEDNLRALAVLEKAVAFDPKHPSRA